MTAYLSYRQQWYVVCEPCALELAFGSIQAATKRRDNHNHQHHKENDG